MSVNPLLLLSRIPGLSGGRWLTKGPLFIAGGVVLAFVLVMAVVGGQRAKSTGEGAVVEEKGKGSAIFAESLMAGLGKNALIPPVGKTEPSPSAAPPLPPVLVARSDQPPLPPPMTRPLRADPDRERVRLAKLQQLEDAIKSRTTVSTTAPRSRASAPVTAAPGGREDVQARLAAVRQQLAAAGDRSDASASYQAKLQALRGAGGGETPPQPPAMKSAAATDRWKLDSQPEAPRSAFELRAGFVLPATLISGINSQLPGQIIGQVSQNVYDTPTGQHLLIPQGTRLVGAYSSEVAYGQARVLVSWQRLVFPDGKAMDIGTMPGADGAGQSGFSDQVNNHYVRIFASAVLMSGITAGIAQTQSGGRGSSDSPNAASSLSESLGQQLGTTTGQMISKNLSIAPTLEIRPGYRFNVIVVKDLTFSKPYQLFDY